MTTFQPSDYGDVSSVYGEADTAPSEQTTAEILEEWSPVLSDLLFGADTREQYAKKKANLESWKQAYSQATSQLTKNIIAMKIRNLEGEVAALEEIAGEERAAARSTQILKWSGIALLGGFGLLGLTSAFLMIRKAGTEKARQKQLKMVVVE